MSNKKATKRALLTSILAICLCLVMLIGSTFAWFTDTASTAVNQIQSGTLKVDIVNEAGESIKGKSMSFVNKDNSSNILWEPGVTFKTPVFQVKNIGNLALKYKLTINGVTGDSKLLEVIKFSVVKEDGTALDLAAFEGYLETANATGEKIYIQGHMEETAGNDYQNKTLEGLGITVAAAQYTYENDSNGNTYDANALYGDVEMVAVTPDTIANIDFNQPNKAFYFAKGDYSGINVSVGGNENTIFEAAEGATFDSLTIGYKVNRYNETDKSGSTMVVRGFNVTGELNINCADGKLIVEDNTAQTIKITMNRQDGKENADIEIKNNKLNGGNYGIQLIPNHSGYTLTISGNEFTNITSHAISIMGYQSDIPASDEIRTTAASITVSGNTFNSYGSGKAAFKIWGDTKLAPSKNAALSTEASTLADSIKANNTFADAVKSNLLADFFETPVYFS